jgi:hypothetical protein
MKRKTAGENQQKEIKKKKKKETFRYKCDDALSSKVSGEVQIFKSVKLRRNSAFYVSKLPKELKFPTDMSVYQEVVKVGFDCDYKTTNTVLGCNVLSEKTRKKFMKSSSMKKDLLEFRQKVKELCGVLASQSAMRHKCKHTKVDRAIPRLSDGRYGTKGVDRCMGWHLQKDTMELIEKTGFGAISTPHYDGNPHRNHEDGWRLDRYLVYLTGVVLIGIVDVHAKIHFEIVEAPAVVRFNGLSGCYTRHQVLAHFGIPVVRLVVDVVDPSKEILSKADCDLAKGSNKLWNEETYLVKPFQSSERNDWYVRLNELTHKVKPGATIPPVRDVALCGMCEGDVEGGRCFSHAKMRRRGTSDRATHCSSCAMSKFGRGNYEIAYSKCIMEGCDKVAYFKGGGRNFTHCISCRHHIIVADDKVGITKRREFCMSVTCTKYATCGTANRPTHCKKCSENEKKKSGKKFKCFKGYYCIDCKVDPPNRAWLAPKSLVEDGNRRPTHCGVCATEDGDDFVSVVNKTCEGEGCDTQPNFGIQSVKSIKDGKFSMARWCKSCGVKVLRNLGGIEEYSANNLPSGCSKEKKARERRGKASYYWIYRSLKGKSFQGISSLLKYMGLPPQKKLKDKDLVLKDQQHKRCLNCAKNGKVVIIYHKPKGKCRVCSKSIRVLPKYEYKKQYVRCEFI